MIRTTCDICGKPLYQGDTIRLRVEDWNIGPSPMGVLEPEYEGEPDAERYARAQRAIDDYRNRVNLALSLDLHRACFVEAVKPGLVRFYSGEDTLGTST